MAARVNWVTADGDAGVARLWADLDARGAFGRERVVIHVARHPDVPLVVTTARALIAYLRAAASDRPIDVIDRDARPGEWEPARAIDLAAAPRYRVAGPCLAEGVPVPALWFEPFSLVTIAAAAPDPACRLAAGLAAQARLLLPLAALDLDVIFEAHRLLAPDLGIVCGSVAFGASAAARWWAASTDDVALELAVAAAAGASAAELPHLRHIARHEMVAAAWRNDGDEVPRLEGFLVPRARTAATRMGRTLAHAARGAREDVTRAGSNLRRLPDFVRRHWLAPLRSRSARA